jgi:hypothetical protein
MIEVEVGQTDVDHAGISLDELLPEFADPRACVEDQRRAVGELDLYTGRVAAVADGRGSWCGK